MQTRVPTTKIRSQILKDRGIVSVQPGVRKHHKIKRLQASALPDFMKTPKMKYLELKYKQPIEKLLLSGSLNAVANKLGKEVDASTISKWIKRLGLRGLKKEVV